MPGAGWSQPVTVPASPAEGARAHFVHGKELYAKGDFDGAIQEWEAAHALVPTPELHFNIARAHEQAGHLAQAVARYQRYLRESGNPTDRASVEATIQRLSEKLEREGKDPRREEQAALSFKKGRELYQAGQYRDALAQLQAAFELVPSATLVYNMAKTREKLGDVAGALADYRRYLAMEPKASDRGDVEHIIQILEQKAGPKTQPLSVQSTPSGADVFVDDGARPAGQTPLVLNLNGGTHRIRVVKAGFQEAQRDFSMPEDRAMTLSLELHAPPAMDGKAPSETVAAAPTQRRAGRSRWPLALAPLPLALAGVPLLASVATAGVLAFRARNVVDGTRAWKVAVAGMAGAVGVGAASVLLGATVAVAVVAAYVALGSLASDGSPPRRDAP